MNGSMDHHAAVAGSGNHDVSEHKFQKPRQLQKDRQNLESLLEVAFLTLANCFPGPSQVSHRAFDELTVILRRYAASILAAWRIPSPRVHAEDVVHDLFLRFIQCGLAKNYDRTVSQRRTYLFGVLRRVLSEAYRAHKPHRAAPLPEDLLDPTPSPNEALAMSEIRDQVSAAIGRLQPRLAYALRCQYGFDDVQPSDIAALSPSARHSRTSRGRKALRPQLQELMDR